MLHRSGSTARAGFTLVELLVVVTIIILLIALTLAGIGYARNSARQVQTTNDIRGLDEAITAFKAKFGFTPPSHIVDRASNGNFYVRRFQVPTNINQPEYQILRRMFPRWDPASQGTVAMDGTITGNQAELAGTVLDNNQALVYFLAGPTNQGWRTDRPNAPSATGNTKIAPFFEFPLGDQLVGSPVPRFVDHYGTPYAYFSSNTDNDRYNAQAQFPWSSPTTTQTFPSVGVAEVAPLLYDPANDPNTPPNATFPAGQGTKTFTVHPLRQGGKWHASGKWQIISAGKDKLFGFGSPQVAAPGPSGDGIVDFAPGAGVYMQKMPGDDDLSNFVVGILGAQ